MIVGHRAGCGSSRFYQAVACQESRRIFGRTNAQTLFSSTCIKDAGIGIRHSRGRILFYTAGSGTGLEGVVALWDNKLTLRKRHVFVTEKYIQDVKQEGKDVPDLLESIMRPTDPVKERLRRILPQMGKFTTKIKENRICTFWMSGKITDFRRRLPAGAK